MITIRAYEYQRLNVYGGRKSFSSFVVSDETFPIWEGAYYKDYVKALDFMHYSNKKENPLYLKAVHFFVA